jgi:surface antigen
MEAWGRLPRLLGCAALAACLSGCGAGALLKKGETDTSIVTGSVTGSDAVQDPDAAAIRNAVTSADLEELGGKAIAWANPGTGSRGSIASVVEYREKNVLCRRFTASRESFDGVMLYSGDACLRGSGFWWMRAFDPS